MQEKEDERKGKEKTCKVVKVKIVTSIEKKRGDKEVKSRKAEKDQEETTREEGKKKEKT